MWRTLNNISRAFRTHIYNPRPSAGVLVDEEQEEAHKSEPVEQRRCKNNELGESTEFCCTKDVKSEAWSQARRHNGEKCGEENGRQNSTDEEEKNEWYKTYHSDFWRLLPGSRHVLEAATLGPAAIWATESDKYKKKNKLLYRVLFALPGRDVTTAKSVIPPDKKHHAQTQPVRQPLAIKDAAGSALDQEINNSMTETLESAMEKFEKASQEYAASCESVLGLKALEAGDTCAAVKHLHRSCRLGNVSACFNLGLCYETGSGVPQDEAKAMHYYKKAAVHGHSMALYNLGLLCLKERGSSSNYSNNSSSSSSCSNTCSDESDHPTSPTSTVGLEMLEEAARLGLPQAQTYLGVHHMTETQEPAKAVAYFKAAADNNDHEGQYYLALCYEQGLGVETNECMAATLYSQAAHAGHDLALYNLAVFNEEGLGGLPKNKATALEMYHKAAELGIWQAEERLDELLAFTSHQAEQGEQAQPDPPEEKNSPPSLAESVSPTEQTEPSEDLTPAPSYTLGRPYLSLLSPSASSPSLDSLSPSLSFTPPHNKGSFITSSYHPDKKLVLREKSDMRKAHNQSQGLLSTVNLFLGLAQPSISLDQEPDMYKMTKHQSLSTSPLSISLVSPHPVKKSLLATPSCLHKSQTFSDFSIIGI